MDFPRLFRPALAAAARYRPAYHFDPSFGAVELLKSAFANIHFADGATPDSVFWDALRRETDEHLRSYDEHLDVLLTESRALPARLSEALGA
jgi:hypothetical protein